MTHTAIQVQNRRAILHRNEVFEHVTYAWRGQIMGVRGKKTLIPRFPNFFFDELKIMLVASYTTVHNMAYLFLNSGDPLALLFGILFLKKLIYLFKTLFAVENCFFLIQDCMHTLALWCSFLLLPARFINNDKTNTSQLKLSRKIMMACLQKVMISGLHRVPIRKSSSFFFPSDDPMVLLEQTKLNLGRMPWRSSLLLLLSNGWLPNAMFR